MTFAPIYVKKLPGMTTTLKTEMVHLMEMEIPMDFMMAAEETAAKRAKIHLRPRIAYAPEAATNKPRCVIGEGLVTRIH